MTGVGQAETDPLAWEGLHDSAGGPAVQLWQGGGSLQHGGAEGVKLDTDVRVHHGAAAVAGGVQHQPAGEAGGRDLLQTGPSLSLVCEWRFRRLWAGDCFRPKDMLRWRRQELLPHITCYRSCYLTLQELLRHITGVVTSHYLPMLPSVCRLGAPYWGGSG